MAHWEAATRQRAAKETASLLQRMNNIQLQNFLLQLIVTNPYGALEVARIVLAED